MSKLYFRKLLKRYGLLERMRALKKRLVHVENEFKPADPRLLISTAKCLHWLHDNGCLEGSDYLEFGIFRGFNLWYAQAYARLLGVRDMRFFGFDSFLGMPPAEGIDAGGPFHEGDFSAYRDEVETWLTRFQVDWNRTFLVEGFFEQSLTPELVKRFQFRRCSLCVVDSDLYSSAVTVLRFVAPFLAERTLLYFDDWIDFGAAEDKGEARAFAEFRDQQAGKLTFEPFVDFAPLGGKGRAFVVSSATSES